ncbi:dTDP-4-dehydrorhamnose reductase [Bordetella sp. FB-8]|uniref:dTDP-4-dehydrorhamnose reductase n=1 Tax=Bordetella sp. FB-8 TaxID=1159870 RepID=UPI00036B69AC|nr:dTDP-4-dehydrorhamnose reductase [Bordetella sp. FB-8]
MKILLAGCNGQLGFELQRSLAVLGEVAAVDRSRCDLADPESVSAAIRAERPDIVVNAAAYTAVDKAEQEPELALQVNGQGPGVMAAEAQAQGALMVHYSTDYVFDGGQETPYRESDATDPAGAYGHSKLVGEQAVRTACERHLILRTSWVYGVQGANFLKTMLRVMCERDALRVVGDQTGAPTGAALIADATAQMLGRYLSESARERPFPYGTYHLAARGETTWYDYAVLIGRLARDAGAPLKVQPEQIQRIATEAYPLPARRPKSSRLDTGKLRSTFGLALPSWEDGVRQVVRILLGA